MENNKKELTEIKKNKVGHGLLIESDGWASFDNTKTKTIKEDLNGMGSQWHVPYPFIVDAVFQKFGVKNANGRIYPEDILKREVEKYQKLIDERMALGECYKPSALILTEDGWKTLEEVKEGDIVLTLNKDTNQIEKQPIIKKIEYEYDGELVHIEGRNINESVTPNHGYPLFNRKHKFEFFKTATELFEDNNLSHYYIPKQGEWVETGDEFFILKGVQNPSPKVLKNHPDCKEDVAIPMSSFMKFLGIYLSEGDYRKTNNDVNVYQKKPEICEVINGMFKELGFKYTIIVDKTGKHTFRICDPRLNQYVSQFGDCYTKYVPKEIKNQSKENLRIFYDWFVLGDGRVRGDKRRKSGRLSDDVFSVSKQLTLDLNEIQLKIGYSGNYHSESRDNDRYVEGRLIEGKNCQPLHFSLRSLTKGIYIDKRFLNITKEQYKGKVMCVEVENHIWYVMENGKSHWTKNCNHPAETTIDLSRISHNIIELHWEGRTLVGKMEINTSEGFRKHGIVTTQGDTVANLLLNGYKIGVSSRGVGSVEQKMGQYIVGDDFELVCWDVVSTPSTPGSYISMEGPEELSMYVENKKEHSNDTLINEKISKLKKILSE